MNRFVSFHVDIDSPQKLLEFYGIRTANYTRIDLEDFYRTALKRVLTVFDELHIKATFFCVGEELARSSSIQTAIKEAHRLGHEIANHSYTHCFGLTQLPESGIYTEITKCSEVIEAITGSVPQGFRAPGYDMNNQVLDILEKLKIRYDSSGFWSVLTPMAKLYHKLLSKNADVHTGYGENSWRLPSLPYYPSRNNWQVKIDYREIVEVPLPRTRLFNLPFYSNFHLLSPKFYRALSVQTMNVKFFVYLVHLIEFVDLTDNIPRELSIHPNLKIGVETKMLLLKEIILRITKRYQAIRTDMFLNHNHFDRKFGKTSYPDPP